MLVKLLATLTVLVANVSLGVCLVLLYSLSDTKESMRPLVAVSGVTVLCLLVLVTATLDNVSWWTKSFPDAFMTRESARELLNRLSVAEPGYKVTVQQDFFKLEGPNQVPRSRQRAVEMYRPRYWDDVTQLDTGHLRPGSVLSVRLEVGPADREAREDFNRFVEEMLDTSSRQSGAYDRRYLTGVTIEARLPQMPLFQGSKVPQFSKNANDAVSFPLSHTFQRILGDPARIFIYHDNLISRTVFPTLLSFKSIIFIIILVIPVLGTCLSLVLADKATLIVFKKRYSRRKTIEESLFDDKSSLHRIKLSRGLTPDLLRFEEVAGSSLSGDTLRDQHLRVLDSIIEDVTSESGGGDSSTATVSEASSSDQGTSSGSTVTPLLARGTLTSAEAGDMPPSYSGLLRGEVVINSSPPCYQDVMDTSNIDEMLTASKETELI